MAWTYKLKDISASGLSLNQVIEPAELELSPEDGTIIGDVRCVGSLVKPDEGTVFFEGGIEGRIARECVRCLSVFEEVLDVPCSVLFKKSSTERLGEAGGRQSGYQEDDDPNGGDEIYPIEGNQIDLLPVIRENIILSSPLQALCSNQCMGLCQGCGVNLNVERCTCSNPSPVEASEGVFHPDLSMANKHSGRSSGNRRKGSMRKL